MTKLSLRNQIFIYFSALTVRLAYVLAQYKFGIVDGNFVSGDAVFYLKLAENILAGNGMANDSGATAFVSPGFPLFLAGCQAVFGADTVWTSLFQCFLSAAICVFTANSTAIMFGRRAGIIAGIIAAGYYELILWTSGQILTEPLYTFILSAALLALIIAVTKSGWIRFASAGALFGLAALVRPTALPVALGIGFLIFAVSILKHGNEWRHALVFITFCLLVMMPWGIRNYLVIGNFTLLSTEGGHVFWLGNNPEYDKFEHPDFQKFGGYTTMFSPPDKLKAELDGKSEVERNRIFSSAARQHIFNHPTAFLIRATHKNWNMWQPAFSISSRRNLLLSWTLYPALLFLSLAGIALAWRRSETGNRITEIIKPVGLLSIFLLIHIAMHTVITGEIRFRVPLWTALIPFAALIVNLIIDFLRNLKSRDSIFAKANLFTLH